MRLDDSLRWSIWEKALEEPVPWEEWTSNNSDLLIYSWYAWAAWEKRWLNSSMMPRQWRAWVSWAFRSMQQWWLLKIGQLAAYECILSMHQQHVGVPLSNRSRIDRRPLIYSLAEREDEQWLCHNRTSLATIRNEEVSPSWDEYALFLLTWLERSTQCRYRSMDSL